MLYINAFKANISFQYKSFLKELLADEENGPKMEFFKLSIANSREEKTVRIIVGMIHRWS